jgi:hypothetical protein
MAYAVGVGTSKSEGAVTSTGHAEDSTEAVVAHGLLNSMAIVAAGLGTLWDHWNDLPPSERDYLFQRVLTHVSFVSDALRDLTRGLPEEALYELDTLQKARSRST